MIYNRKWTSKTAGDPAGWKNYPPEGMADRLNAWEHNSNLLRGFHDEEFVKFIGGKFNTELEAINAVNDAMSADGFSRYSCYVAANFCGLLARTFAFLLFGEPIKIEPLVDASTDEGKALQDAINRIAQNNQLQKLNIMQATTSIAQGYSFYRVRWGKNTTWTESGVIIEAIPGYLVEPILSPDNIKEPKGFVISIEIEHKDKKYLKREIHEPGKITNMLNVLQGEKIGQEVPLSTIPGLEWLEEQDGSNDFPGLFVVPVMNREYIDEFWGASDFEDIESIQDAINNRITNIDVILDKHASPILAVPIDMQTGEDENGQSILDKRMVDTVGVDDPNLIKYITWDGKLEAAENQINLLIDLLCMTGQLSPALLQKDKTSYAESGRALKYRLVQTMAKVRSKALSYDAALRNIFYAALWLNHKHNGGPEPKPVKIIWADGLPDDDLEITQLHVQRVMGGIESVETAVKHTQELTTEEVDAEVARIETDKGNATITL